ncbi:lamin tail domain-containing protein [Granulosicoccaceae sp. 1_MG-2023]|nr:lamin tail domain-containing protein [Granulosicoccaceae sp. 1_MG-2023]
MKTLTTDPSKLSLICILALNLTLSGCGGSGSSSDDNDSSAGQNSGSTDNDDSDNGSNAGPEQPVAESPAPDSPLVINEILTAVDFRDDAAVENPRGENTPWLEIYNRGDSALNLGDYTLSVPVDYMQSWNFPDMTLAAGEHLIVWGDGQTGDDTDGNLFSSIYLRSARVIDLRDADGNLLDRLDMSGFPADISYGRYPDGDDWRYVYSSPSPGESNPAGDNGFALNCEMISLGVGDTLQAVSFPPRSLTWEADTDLLKVSDDGAITAIKDQSGDSQVSISATDEDGNTEVCDITVVNWKTNQSVLLVSDTPPADFLLDTIDGVLYYTYPGKLLATTNGMQSYEQVGSFPETPGHPIMVKTDNGYYVSSGANVYHSSDLADWSVSNAMRTKTLLHGFASFKDNDGTERLFAGEYSTEKANPHSVYRGLLSKSGAIWDEVLRFDSLEDYYNSGGNLTSIRHIHLTMTDPYTGDVWVGTGDADEHSRLYYSPDNGESFILVGVGSQKYRTLSMWFTEDYVYWNMDSERAEQHVYRLPRSVYRDNGNSWPSLTPELTSGSTVPGLRYLVTANNDGSLPVSVGHLYTETEARTLHANASVRVIDDEDNDYSEDVAELRHASQWYHSWVEADDGSKVLLMSTSVESIDELKRDNNSRIFGFRELDDGSVDVQEVMLVKSEDPDEYVAYSQLTPVTQDADGFIYLQGRLTPHRIYKARLMWHNAD